MEPVKRLPRASELLTMERKKSSASRESITDSAPGSTENLSEGGSQKKAKLRIPKPVKSLVSKGGKNEEKKKKEDANNNLSSKGSRESLDQVSTSGKSNGRRSLGRRQASNDSGFTSYLGSSPKQDTKDSWTGKGSKENLTDTPSSSSRASRLSRKQASIDEDFLRTSSKSETDQHQIRSESKSSKEGDVAVVKRRRRNTERIMRDYRLSMNEVKALKCILDKVDLYQEEMRDEILPLLKLPFDSTDGKADNSQENAEIVSESVIRDAEKESLKEKLFLSRKELDSYINFTKKMEREKRTIVSDKEELETRVQWQERRMTSVESENKALKIERADLLNQIYKLRCPANVPIAERGKLNQKSNKDSEDSQPDLEVSRQRLMYEAESFAQERAKLIKERQRLDEEVRKVQIRCVSLLAQVQHSEKIIDDLQRDKEELKSKLTRSSKKLLEDNKKLQEKLQSIETMKIKGAKNESELDNRVSVLIDHVKDTEATKIHLKEQTSDLEQRLDDVTRENRELAEDKLKLEYEVMSLKDTVTGLEKAKNDAEVQLVDLDTKLNQSQAEIKLYVDQVNNYKSSMSKMGDQVEDLTRKLADMHLTEINLKSDQNAFQKFLVMLSVELEEKLGEDIVSKDIEAKSLEEKADILGKQISSHLTPSRKNQNYEDMKEELDELRQENSAIKYALSSRLEIQSIQKTQVCDCSHEKDLLQQELQESKKTIDRLEDEVQRLHEDKQSLLMSFLNLQAAARSREPSRTGTEGSLSDDEGDISDDESGEESEEESEEGSEEGTSLKSPVGVNVSLISDESDGEESGSEDTDGLQSADAASEGKSENKYSLPLLPPRPARSTENIGQAVEYEGNIDELQHKLRDVTKTKERLETERVGLLDSLCKQAEQIDELREELESLQEVADKNSRENSLVQGEECGNCSKNNQETRQYLGIIEGLTEDKLQLEKALADVRRDKEKLQEDIEQESDKKFAAERELEHIQQEKDDHVKKVEEEMHYLLQNLTNAEDENKTLEEHLQKVRQDKVDLLDELKVAEKDRLDLVQSLQILTSDKVRVEDELSKAKEEIRRMKKQLREVLQSSDAEGSEQDSNEDRNISTRCNVDEDPIVVDKSSSMVKSAPSSTLPDITSISRRRSSLSEERKQVLSGKRSEFRRSRDILSREENVFEMSDEKVEVEEGSLSSSADHQMHVESEIQKLRREVEQLRQLKSISEFEGRSRSPKKDSQRHRRTYPMLPDPNTLLDESKRRRKTSEPILHRSPSISKAKTLCFQISFNGVPLMEKTEFEED